MRVSGSRRGRDCRREFDSKRERSTEEPGKGVAGGSGRRRGRAISGSRSERWTGGREEEGAKGSTLHNYTTISTLPPPSPASNR